ncbi:unnamed protein product, partial [Callosobruchus maculatus]
IASTSKQFLDSQVQTESTLYIDKYTQTPDKLSSNSPRKKALRHKIATMEKSIASTSRQSLETKITLEDVTKFLTENYSGKSCDLLKAQLFLLDKAPKGSRYSDDFKQFALRCYFLGPKAYKKLSAIYRLPSKSTLERYTKNWMVKPGFNDFIFQCIQFRAIYLKEKEKDCILCIDEISLKSNLYYDISNDKIVGFQEGLTETSIIASSALTVMARGLASNWRLPLAFFFYRTSANADDLKQILLTTVQKCKSIGLNVLGVVSDQGSNFQKLVKTLNVTQENPFFVVDNARIVYLFDIPHLLKSIRNNFFSYTFVLSNQEIRKQYLETFYSHDKTKQHRLAPKLTDDHIYPNNFQKMKVKLACQVLSHSVAAGMQTYIEKNVLPVEASTTAAFIQKMDDLFNLLNPSNFENCQAFMGTEKQLQLIEESYNMFENMEVLNHEGKSMRKQLKFISGWKLTLKSLLELWKILKEKNYKYLFTRSLNQDCLENFFGQVRNCSGNAKNPTPIQFCRAFKKLFSLKFFDQVEGANCTDDVNHLLLNINSNTEKYSEILVEQDVSKVNPIRVFTSDYQNLRSPEGNGLVYVTGYLLRKCLIQHTCNICVDFASSSKDLTNEETAFCKLKAYTDTKSFGGLTLPSKHIAEQVINMENIFIEYFNSVAARKGIGNFFKDRYSDINLNHPCKDFPLSYFISLYVRVRIYFTLKSINQDVKNNKFRPLKNLKLQILQNL